MIYYEENGAKKQIFKQEKNGRKESKLHQSLVFISPVEEVVVFLGCNSGY